MPAGRIALVFDNLARPETTGLYCRRALSQLALVEQVLPDDLERITPQQYSAVIAIDDGLGYALPTSVRPLIYWAIDTHLDYPRSLNRALECDLVFAAQRAGVERLRRDGVTSAQWLPLACDPALHGRIDRSPEWDWSFIGHLTGGTRNELLGLLAARWPKHYMGSAYYQAMAQIYSRSRIVFNRSVEDDLNMRVFEGLASGSLLMTNVLEEAGQDELFQSGRHLATYRSADELLERMAYYLHHASEREAIAAAGRAEVLAHHTYRHRMLIMLSSLEQWTNRCSIAVTKSVCEATTIARYSKGATYFEWERPDVMALIPSSARFILDLGCGGGRLGAALKHRQSCAVWGVEQDPAAAERAAARLDRVLVASVDDQQLPIEPGNFDVVICADILEHLRHPEKVLARCHEWLKPDGSLVISVPNLQHHSVITGLLEGNFTYEPAGLLDEDHVRGFTRREIEKLCFRMGFEIEERRAVPGTGWEEWEQQGRPGQVQIGGLTVTGLLSERAADFYTYQYLLRARPVSRKLRSLTSIVIVTHNQWAFTQRCLESLRFRTDEAYELIVVDNGSTDGTVNFLQSDASVQLIANSDNRGFPAAVNQGLAVCRGEQIVLLNNDTILTTGWLARLLDVLDRDATVGLVGPVSNCVSGPQQVPVPYRDLASLDGFAWDRSQGHRGEVLELDRLVGFCLLMRRAVYEQIGGMDERFGIGNFEDDDFCRRARAAGWRTVAALDSFVHHFGGQTFRHTGIDFGRLMAENEAKFNEKWGNRGDSQQPSGKPISKDAGESPGLSLCMIVRNNETTIGPCLESIRPWVDEMVVVDTGSTDRTPEICAELGAEVHRWPWCDDFAAARNESIRHAKGKWVFWMDSDDTIPAECGRKLRELVERPHASHVYGYVMQVHCPAPADEVGHREMTVVDHIKVFRNLPELRFEHRIHEQILPAIRRAGGDVEFTDLYVVHSGSDQTVEGRAKKLERDFRLLALDLAERPDHPFVLFNLGMTHADCSQFDQAESTLRRCLDVSNPHESHVRKAYALLISVLHQQNAFNQANEVCHDALTLYPDDKELLFRRGMVAHRLGKLEEAITCYLAVINGDEARHFSSIDQELSGYKARHNLAIVYEDCQQFANAAEQWQAILAIHPDYEPALSRFRDCSSSVEVGIR